MSDVVEVFAWGEEWSPIVVAGTGSILTAVYYPHKAGGDLIIMARDHAVHCCICDQDIPGTKPHTRQAYFDRALFGHLRSHGKRTRKRNKYIESLMPAGGEA